MIAAAPHRRRQARLDVEAAIDFYLAEAGEHVALAFIDAVEASVLAISRHPAAGSPRYGQALNLPQLRSRAVKDFPYLIFYAEIDNRIEIWRVLHARRDIPQHLAEDG